MTSSRRTSLAASITLLSALLHSPPSAGAASGALRRRRNRNGHNKNEPYTHSKPTSALTRHALQDDIEVATQSYTRGGGGKNVDSRNGGRLTRDTPTKRETQLMTSIKPTRPQQYIVGGTQAQNDRYGYYTSVYQSFGSIDYHICGASLIHDDIVLTAAHCAVDADSVRIGAYTHWVNTNGGAPMHETEVTGRIEHPNYFVDKFNRLHYDIALLKLKEPVTDSDLLKSIVTLDLSGEHSNGLMAGESLTTVGLGQLKEDGDVAAYLQEVDVSFVPREICYKTFHGGINSDAMCAWANGKDACGGDSGGPLIAKGSDAENDVQIGVTSWGAGCASPFPGVYSYIHHVSEWLEEEICKLTSVSSETFGCVLDGDIPPLPSEDADDEEEEMELELELGRVDKGNDGKEENNDYGNENQNVCYARIQMIARGLVRRNGLNFGVSSIMMRVHEHARTVAINTMKEDQQRMDEQLLHYRIGIRHVEYNRTI